MPVRNPGRTQECGAIAGSSTDAQTIIGSFASGRSLISPGAASTAGLPALLDAVRKVHRDGEIRELELEIPLPGRPSAWVLARVAPLLDAHVLLLIDDLTTAHRVEEDAS